MNLSAPRRPLFVAQLFLLVDALFWFIFSLILAAGWHPSISGVHWGMAGLSFLTGCALLLLVFMLRRRSRIAYLLALGLLSMISVLTLTDEFGIADFLVLVLHVAPILLLWIGRRKFFPSNRGDLQGA
jgi:hypothetical protein